MCGAVSRGSCCNVARAARETLAAWWHCSYPWKRGFEGKLLKKFLGKVIGLFVVCDYSNIRETRASTRCQHTASGAIDRVQSWWGVCRHVYWAPI